MYHSAKNFLAAVGTMLETMWHYALKKCVSMLQTTLHYALKNVSLCYKQCGTVLQTMCLYATNNVALCYKQCGNNMLILGSSLVLGIFTCSNQNRKNGMGHCINNGNSTL
jgi:hypothetical protein